MTARLIGFLEEAPGVKSMTRLTIAEMAALCALLVLTDSAVAVVGICFPERASAAAGIIAALTAPLAALAGGIWAALRERNTGVPDAAPPTPPAAQ